MEYRLNKIDMELRMKINEVTKEGIVHAKQGIKTNEEKNENNSRPFNAIKLYHKKTKIFVNATRNCNIEIEADKEFNNKETMERGTLLDIRK